MRLITDVTASNIPGFVNLGEGERTQLLDDAARVQAYVSRNEWLREDDLRQWGELNEIGPDRMNGALGFLRETGRLIDVPEYNATPVPSQELLRAALEEMTKDQVWTLVQARDDIELTSSATKAEMIDALLALAR